LLDNVRVNGPPAFANSAPAAVADTYTVNKNTALVVAAPGVLSNDNDPQLNALTAVLETAPAFGTLTLNANGGFSYQPNTGYTGSDSFTYHANDGLLNSNTVAVNITVREVPTGLLVNPSFESDFTAWTKTGSAAIGSYPGTDGVKIVEFNNSNQTPNGLLSQSFATVAGQAYRLTFDLCALAYTRDSQIMQVTANGTGNLLSQAITIPGLGEGLGPWLPQSLTFTADSTSTTIAFRDQSTATIGIDLLLDNVRVVALEAVPPSTISQSSSGNPVTPSLVITPESFVVSMIAPSTGSYVLERSEDLKTWQQIDSTHSNAQELIEFHDLREPLEAEAPKTRMFYRIGLEAASQAE
jgi:VCBS repeat-containing protein